MRDGAGERSLLVSKEFALQQAGWDGGTVQFYERLGTTLAEFVNRAGDQLLAGAGFAVNEDGRVGGGHSFNLAQHPLQRGARTNDLFEVHLATEFVLKIELLLRQSLTEFRNLAIGQCVVDCDGDLAGELRQEVDVCISECILLPAGQAKHAEDAIATDEREHAQGLDSLFRGNPVIEPRTPQLRNIPEPCSSGAEDLS